MIPIDQQIKCVREEIKRRERFFPMLIEQGDMEPERATLELETMKHVMQTLTQLQGLVRG